MSLGRAPCGGGVVRIARCGPCDEGVGTRVCVDPWLLQPGGEKKNRALGENRGELFLELSEISLFAPGDSKGIGADQLQIGPRDKDSNCVFGQLWRAVKVSSNADVFIARDGFSICVSQGRDAVKPAESVAAETPTAPDFGKLFPTYAPGLGLSAEECDSWGPSARHGRVAGNATSTVQI